TRCLSDWSSDVCSSDLDARGLPGGVDSAPVLFIMGLGADSEAWQPQRDALAGLHPTIALDNRGIGRSSRVPTLDYRISSMAADRSEERRVGKEWRWGGG